MPVVFQRELHQQPAAARSASKNLAPLTGLVQLGEPLPCELARLPTDAPQLQPTPPK